MTGDGPVRVLCRSIADHQRIGDEGLAPIAGTFTGQPQRASGSQAGREVPPQGAAPLNIKRLINGLVADAHTQVLGKVPPQGAAQSALGSTQQTSVGFADARRVVLSITRRARQKRCRRAWRSGLTACPARSRAAQECGPACSALVAGRIARHATVR